MSFIISFTPISSSLHLFSHTIPSNLNYPPKKSILFNLNPIKIPSFPLKTLNCIQSSSPKFNPFPHLDLYPDQELDIIPVSSHGQVSFRLRKLVSEFRSLPEPIDRVKRLLEYATMLPQLGELTRLPENRVPGCAAQVWLEVEMDEFGRIRFGADSDSEITKGFCSCLIFLLDGAYPQDVLKFRSLPEPIDRVKRLLEYATMLPQLDELTRLPENRVPGCAARIWLEVEMDEFGRMRFGADSDSEITKGFCSCLIFLLDGAYPQDVLKVKAEDLADMNVGLPVRSRVNSWHNVLINMQERTKSFIT